MDLDKLKSVFKKITDTETYSLSLITTWLKERDISFKYSSSLIDNYCIYEHGIRIHFEGFDLSVQTHPMIAGWAFVETLKTDDMLSDTRYKTPEDFFNFLENLLKEEKLKENVEEEKEKTLTNSTITISSTI